MSTASRTVRIKLRASRSNTLFAPGRTAGRPGATRAAAAGNPAVEIEIDGTALVMRAVLNGKSVRRAIKTIAELGPDNVNVLLQGNLRPPAATGGPYELDAAGLNVTPKTAKPEAT